MSSRPGKREREVRKRHRRAWIKIKDNCSVHADHATFQNFFLDMGADAVTLKLGHKHLGRHLRKQLVCGR